MIIYIFFKANTSLHSNCSCQKCNGVIRHDGKFTLFLKLVVKLSQENFGVDNIETSNIYICKSSKTISFMFTFENYLSQPFLFCKSMFLS